MQCNALRLYALCSISRTLVNIVTENIFKCVKFITPLFHFIQSKKHIYTISITIKYHAKPYT